MSVKQLEKDIEELYDEAGEAHHKAQKIKDDFDSISDMPSDKKNKMEKLLDTAQEKTSEAKTLEQEKDIESSLNEVDPDTKARADAAEGGDTTAVLKRGDGSSPEEESQIDHKAYGQMEDPAARADVLEEKGYNRKEVGKDPEQELKEATFAAYMENAGEKAHLNDIELKTLNTLKGDEGGFVTDEETASTLIRKLEDLVHIRDLARTFKRDSSVTKFPTIQATLESEWALELEGISETEDDPFGKTQFDANSIKMILKVSEEMLMDSFIDIRQEIVREASRHYAEVEEAAFLNGTGETQPLGILEWSNLKTALGGSDSSSHQLLFFDPKRYYIVDRMDIQTRVLEERYADDWEVGYRFWKRTDASPIDQDAFVVGQTGTISTTDVNNILYSLKAQYRRNGQWMLHRNSIKAIRNLTDNDDQFLWQPGLQEGEPDMLGGFPIRESEFMPDPEA